MSSEKVENVNKSSDEPFLHFLKYEQCIYVWAVFGAVSQVVVICVIIAYLVTGIQISDRELEKRSTVYSVIGVATLTGTAFSEILLIRAVNQRFLRYIQWWMVSTMIIFLFSILMTVIAGFTLYQHYMWITLGFLYLVIRLPFQVYFVDKFANAEIIHKEPQDQNPYNSVLYRRFH